MASGIWVAGPTEIHVGVKVGGGLAFLGWSLEGVRVRFNPFWNNVHADLAGMMPLDVQLMGEVAQASCDLAVWDEAVLQACQSRGNPYTGSSGFMAGGYVGGLMLTEGAAYRTLIYPPFRDLKPSQAAQLPYNFLRAFLAGPDDIHPLGTRPKRVRVIFQAIPAYNPLDGSWTLWNRDSSGKPPAI
jgi:hypothetical protein